MCPCADIFSDQAEAFVQFVTRSYLPACHPSDHSSTLYSMNCSSDVILKCRALKAVAKSLSPRGHSPIPEATRAAAIAFFDFLEDDRCVSGFSANACELRTDSPLRTYGHF